MPRPAVSIIVPTLNEASSIASVLDELPKRKDIEIIVVDGLSTDRTVEIAKKHGARIVLCREKGKGIAMVRGAQAAQADIIAYIDGDGTYEVDPLLRHIELVRSGAYDMVAGRRIAEPGAMSFVHRVGNYLLSACASALYERVGDLLTGMRVLRKDTMLQMHLTSRGFGIEAEMFVKGSLTGLRMLELPIRYYHREGKSKLNGVDDGIRILMILLVNALTYRSSSAKRPISYPPLLVRVRR